MRSFQGEKATCPICLFSGCTQVGYCMGMSHLSVFDGNNYECGDKIKTLPHLHRHCPRCNSTFTEETANQAKTPRSTFLVEVSRLLHATGVDHAEALICELEARLPSEVSPPEKEAPKETPTVTTKGWRAWIEEVVDRIPLPPGTTFR